MDAKRPTIGDVARRANVSKTTVSHVMNNTRFVSEETKRRVLLAMADLGYRPNALARSLSTSKTGTIGVLIADVSHFFFAQVLRGIEDVLMPQGCSILICNTAESPEREKHYLDLLLRQRAAGIIAAPASPEWDILPELERHNTPVVFIDRSYETLQGPFVGVDNVKGAYLGVSHLIECGCRRLAILAGDLRLSSLRGRLDGFRQALHDHDIPLPEAWVISGLEHVQEDLQRLMMSDDRPSGIFCSVTSLSLMALATLHNMGLHCPEDVALVGFDDHPWAIVSDPPLTVVRQPAREIGQAAARILLALIGGTEHPSTRVVLDCELVVRESCGVRQRHLVQDDPV